MTQTPTKTAQPPYKTEMLSFRACANLKEMLDRLSAREHLSRSDYIRDTLERAATK
jgi:predicted DNA-binding protein